MRKWPGDLEEWLVTLQSFLVDGTLLVGVLLGLHQFGSRIGEWLLDVYSEKPRLSWVVTGVACWTVFFAAAGCVVPIHGLPRTHLRDCTHCRRRRVGGL